MYHNGLRELSFIRSFQTGFATATRKTLPFQDLTGFMAAQHGSSIGAQRFVTHGGGSAQMSLPINFMAEI